MRLVLLVAALAMAACNGCSKDKGNGDASVDASELGDSAQQVDVSEASTADVAEDASVDDASVSSDGSDSGEDVEG